MEPSILAILKVLGMAEDISWGDSRARTEEDWARWTTKYRLSAVLVLAAFLFSTVSLILQTISFTSFVLIALFTLAVSGIVTTILGPQGDGLKMERRMSEGFLRGRTPVAVAAYQIDTLPGRTLLLIRAGGVQAWSRNELVYNEAVPDFLSGLFTARQRLKNYLLVGCWEKTGATSVEEVRLREKGIFTWLNRRVGCPVSKLTDDWWRQLEEQEIPSAHG